MKRLQTSLALLALFALMLPCTHAEEHHHHDASASAELRSMHHAACHTCSDEPCAESKAITQVMSVSAVPVRQILLVRVLRPELPIQTSALLLPTAELQLLQTVQLLI